jgi:putative endonuclease
MHDGYSVYILATRKEGPIYVGVTNDLHRRVYEHKTHAIRGFTNRYNVDRLVYSEVFDSPDAAIAREKQLKRWRRDWKVALIERENPDWNTSLINSCPNRLTIPDRGFAASGMTGKT